jgi:hypothetical protein
MREHRLLRRVHVEERRQLAERAAVGERRGDVRPLARVGALGEQPAELVQRGRRRGEDPVGVLVDEADRAQYFRK